MDRVEAQPHRVVVVGHGMVATRFLDDLDRCARTTSTHLDVTVLGDEPHEPYNRLMLSEVVAGRADITSLTLPRTPAGITVHRGTSAVRLDRNRRVVVDEHGHEHAYDTVVLATGAEAYLPPVDGADDPAHGTRGVRALRTIDDCRALLAACSTVSHVTVVGGGLLGIEIACGLRTRGVDVTIVHLGGHVLDRQLDAASAALAEHTLRDLGVDVRTDVMLTQVVRDEGAVSAVRLGDGTQIATDLVVLSAGVVPRVGLAREAGLPTARGVVVDLDLRSPEDRSVAAIGDCAETPDGCPGLLAPGWDQARRLARQLCGLDDMPDQGSGAAVLRLKAVGLEVVTLGETPPADEFAADGPRVVSLVDAYARRSVRIAVRDRRVIGAVCVGAPEVAADLTIAYERRTPVPVDPALLLVPGRAATGVSTTENPTVMPGSATVCRCNGVTKQEIVAAHIAGDRSVAEVACRTRATTGCGGCTSVVDGLIEWMNDIDPDVVVASPITAPAST